MAKDDTGGQLSLLGRVEEDAPSTLPSETARRAPLRFAKWEAKGRLGWGSVDHSVEELTGTHKVSIVLLVSDDVSAWSEVIGLDVRHLRPATEGAQLALQVDALAADLRAGRRVCVLADDPTQGAFVVGAALIEVGADAAQATAALGGRTALGPERHAALVDRSVARGREARRDSTPLFARAAQVEDASSASGGLDDRVAGAVLGAAIGDAMGHPTEFVTSFEAIRATWPPDGVQGFERFWDQDGRRVAPYTDDTQMAECVLRALLWSREHDADLDATMTDLARRFVDWSIDPQGGHRSPGNACLAGCRQLAAGARWDEAGGARAGGCGSVMRAYPFGLFFVDDLERAEAWAVSHSKLTHRDPIALAASAAMAVGVARTLRGESVTRVLSEMVAAACRYSPKTAEMMALAMHEASTGVAPEVTLTRLEGWAAHEAIAAAVYLVARHPDDPRRAILEAANTPGDSDSLATLAGALVGARVGLSKLPPGWVGDVERSAELRALAELIIPRRAG